MFADTFIGGWESVFLLSLLCLLIGLALRKVESRAVGMTGRILTYLGGAVVFLDGVLLVLIYAQ